MNRNWVAFATHTYTSHTLALCYAMLLAMCLCFIGQVEKGGQKREKTREKNFDDPMRIKVLDIVLPFLLCFNWSIKETGRENEAKAEERAHRKNASWPIESSGYELESIGCLCVSLHTSSEFRFFFALLLLWSMMKRSRKQNPTQNEQPKVLLAFQSSRAGNKIYNQYIYTHEFVIDDAEKKMYKWTKRNRMPIGLWYWTVITSNV